MRDHIIEVGHSATVGDVLAVLQTSSDEYLPPAGADLGNLPPLRVATNIIERD
jgi:hypothetical protein